MATWKKVIVSGSNISELANNSGYLTAGNIGSYIPNIFATASYDGTNLLADSTADTLNFASSSGQGLTISANAGTDTLTWGLSAIPNTSLANSSVTVGTTAISLGGSATTIAGLVSVTSTAFTGSLVGTAATASNITPAISTIGVNRVTTANANGTLTAQQNLTFDGATLTITGNLTVNGTTTTVNTTNLIVSDQFILMGSGSLAKKDGGIVVQSDAADNTGYAFALNATSEVAPRWGVTSSYDAGTTTFTPDEYAVTVKSVAGTWTAASAAPTYGGTAFGYGSMVIDNTGQGDIWIYCI